MAEQLIRNQQVIGSIPIVGFIKYKGFSSFGKSFSVFGKKGTAGFCRVIPILR